MFLNLLNSNNYGSYNITLAKIFGLDASAYCSALLNIYDKAKRKNKTVNGDFFWVDRKYIQERTAVTIARQLEIDLIWKNINLISKDSKDVDTIKINTELIASLVAGAEAKLKEHEPINFQQPSGQDKFEYIKSKLNCDDEEILQALKIWIDSSRTHPKGDSINLEIVKIFIKNLNLYAKEDKELKLKLIEIATVHKHISFQWTINEYENQYISKNQKNKSVKTKSKQSNYRKNIATSSSLSNTKF
jgi:hypothetical protein